MAGHSDPARCEYCGRKNGPLTQLEGDLEVSADTKLHKPRLCEPCGRIAAARKRRVKITACQIIPPQRFGDTAKVLVALNDSDDFELLFDYFNDELHFHAMEFVGLTKDEALDLKAARDETWLRS